KVLANSTSYGAFAEMNPVHRRTKRPTPVERFGLAREIVEVETPEEPGRWCFPPLAASIAGAARLMLAMLERCVSDFDGTYAFCDTDSMAVVANQDGGLVECEGGSRTSPQGRDAIQALSFSQVTEIVERFRALSPYDSEVVPA